VAEVEVTEERMRVLAAMNEFSQAGRYPDSTSPTPTPELVKQRVDEADEVFRWLMSAP
jgi:hypothetical protein